MTKRFDEAAFTQDVLRTTRQEIDVDTAVAIAECVRDRKATRVPGLVVVVVIFEEDTCGNDSKLGFQNVPKGPQNMNIHYLCVV